MTHEIFELLKEETLDLMYERGHGGKVTVADLFEIFEKAGKRYENGEIRKPYPIDYASEQVKSYEKRLWV